MNSKHIAFSAALLLGASLWSQETKTYKETFIVGDDTVLEINTSNTDIEFEKWDKDQVEILATVTLEEATKEEAEDYFENVPFKIMGNSQQIEVVSTGRSSWNFPLVNSDFDIRFDVEPLFSDFEIPDLPELAVIPDLPSMPSLPQLRFKNFDYEAYKDKGKKYLKEWAESFEEGFDEEYEEKMKEWSKRVEEKAKKWEKKNAKRLEEREKKLEERALKVEEMMQKAERNRAEIEKKREEVNSIFFSENDDDPRIFYFSSDGEHKKYKVKKTIKIKMPNSVRLKLNVKHGEVKLASSTQNMNASLRYASLLASTIEGKNTAIEASYSPIIISNWNNGDMKLNYCEEVKLGDVGRININAVSSNISLGRVYEDVYLVNDFGTTEIKTISPKTKRVFVKLKNGEFYATPPRGEYNLYLSDDYSNVRYPKNISVTKNNLPFEDKDFITAGPNKKRYPSIIINSKYSDVILEE